MHVAQYATHPGSLPDRRIRTLIVPREHGAWGLLLVPLATGGAIGLLAGGDGLSLISLTAAALALFWLRKPRQSWMGTRLLRAQSSQERRGVGLAVLAIAIVAVSALMAIFWSGKNRQLLWLGMFAVAAFITEGQLRKLGRRTRMLAQVVGTIGLTVTAPAAFYVVTGNLGREAWMLWLANFVFAGNQIHFVQLRIHSARLSGWAQK